MQEAWMIQCDDKERGLNGLLMNSLATDKEAIQRTICPQFGERAAKVYVLTKEEWEELQDKISCLQCRMTPLAAESLRAELAVKDREIEVLRNEITRLSEQSTKFCNAFLAEVAAKGGEK